MNSPGNSPKLAVVITHPIQHFAPVYQEIARSNQVSIRVFFLAKNGVKPTYDDQFGVDVKWNIPLTEGYDHEFVEPDQVFQSFSFLEVDSKSLLDRLQSYDPDFLWLHGYASLANWRCVFARSLRSKIIYTSDSNALNGRSAARHLLKKIVVSFFLKHCNFFLSISPQNKRYLRLYGVEKSAIIDSSFPIDMQRLDDARENISQDEQKELRRSLKLLDSDRLILFAGKLLRHKRPQDAIRAIKLVGDTSIKLIVVGSGELEAELKQLVNDLALSDRVRFTGFVNQAEMPMYLELAEALVFPSEVEPYGAIASEALPFALPILASRNIGAVGASILDGQNAMLFDAGDVKQLANNITQLFSSDCKLLDSYSKFSRTLSAEHNKSRMANDVLKICSGQV